MDLLTFKQRIQNTPLFDEEQKKYFLERAESYPPETRQKMIDILEKHEKEVLEFAEQKLLEIQEKKAKDAQASKQKMEEEHAKEVAEAEATLEADLNGLD